jgi:hypothetical protein
MMVRTIVALCGKKGSGKDTAAQALLDKGWTGEKFAGPLKDACRTLFGFDESQVEGHLKDVLDPRWGTTPRAILQFMGTEVFQYKINEILPGIGGRKFWTKSMIQRIQSSDGDVVITDMRFQHEVDALRAMDPLIYKVISIKIIRTKASTDATGTCSHASETELDSIRCDHIIQNDQDVKELWQKVCEAVEL